MCGASTADPNPDSALVLLVDDHDDALDLYQTYLSFKGYPTITASDGMAGVALARAKRPGIIFMDLRMPKVSGMHALHELRRDPSFQHVPIVALTACAEDERRAALAAGFTEVLLKPCDPDDLVSAIERLLAQTGGASEASVRC